MAKFHINKHGVPAPCRAEKGKCPLGGDSGNDNHFNTQEEAQIAADKMNKEEHGLLGKANENTLDSLLNVLDGKQVLEDFAYSIDQDNSQAINDELIEEYDIYATYEGDSSEQMLNIAEQISCEKVLEEIEERLSQEEFEEIIDKLHEEYHTKELLQINKDWQLDNYDMKDLQADESMSVNLELNDEGIIELANDPAQSVEKPALVRGIIKQESVFASYGKLGKHRIQYYRQELNVDTKDKVKALMQAWNEIEVDKEDDITGLMSILKENKDDEYVLKTMLYRMNDSEWGNDNRYFNRADEILEINSKDGFTFGLNDNESKSIYLDKKGIPEEALERQRETLNNRKKLYSTMTDDPKLTKALSTNYNQSMATINYLAKRIFDDEKFKELTSEKGSLEERWKRVYSHGIEELGKKEFTNKMLQHFLAKGDNTIERLDELDASLNINSIRETAN